MEKNEKMSAVIGLQEDSRGIKEGKFVSISISASTHEKLQNLCWLIKKDRKPKMGLVASNIMEAFIEDNREDILKLQSGKVITF